MNNRVIPLHLVDFRNFYLDIVLFLISPVLSLYVSFKNLTYNRRSIYIIGAFFVFLDRFFLPLKMPIGIEKCIMILQT